MKILKVKKKDATVKISNVEEWHKLIVEIDTTQKWFGNKNYLVSFACYEADDINVIINGPQELSCGTHGDLDDAKNALKNIKQSEKDLQQAITWAEKKVQEWQKKIKEFVQK